MRRLLSRQQRPERQDGRAHCLYQFIRRFEKLDVRGGNLVSAKLRSQHVRADVFQQTPLRNDVANVREIVERDRFRRQNRRRHARERRVFRAADCDATLDWVTATDAEFLHVGSLKEKLENREW